MLTTPRSILIVDDHALFRSGLRLVLAADLADVAIYEASSIHEAINNTRTEPSVILLDIELNGLNGLDGIALLKRTWPHVEVVMLSSDTSSATAQLALTRGARAFVTKAETAKKILSIVQDIIGQQSVPQPHSVTHTQLASDTAQQLTARQSEVLDLLSKGFSNKVIARKLNCAENTVRGHVQAILVFFNAASRSEAVYAAKQQGILH
jgi:DNA-binding NarL/FixJ family response regulator